MKPSLLTDSCWRVYTSLAFAPFFCAVMVGTKWSRHSYDDHFNDLYFFLMLICFAVGVLAVRLASCVRYLDRRHDEFAKQSAFDSALDSTRLLRLEEAIAELKAAKPK